MTRFLKCLMIWLCRYFNIQHFLNTGPIYGISIHRYLYSVCGNSFECHYVHQRCFMTGQKLGGYMQSCKHKQITFSKDWRTCTHTCYMCAQCLQKKKKKNLRLRNMILMTWKSWWKLNGFLLSQFKNMIYNFNCCRIIIFQTVCK